MSAADKKIGWGGVKLERTQIGREKTLAVCSHLFQYSVCVLYLL